MRIKSKPTPKNKVEIWSRDPSAYHGYIMRTPLYSTEFGNWGAVQYSILGKRYWSAGGSGTTCGLYLDSNIQTPTMRDHTTCRRCIASLKKAGLW